MTIWNFELDILWTHRMAMIKICWNCRKIWTSIFFSNQLTKYSNVLGISKIDFIPLETTAMRVRPSSVRSADMSIIFSTSRCTPPIPPVANTSIPSKFAIIIVPATVVPPFRPLLITYAKSRREVFTTGMLLVHLPRVSKSVSVKPTFILPFIIPIVAGTAFWRKKYQHLKRTLSCKQVT